MPSRGLVDVLDGYFLCFDIQSMAWRLCRDWFPRMLGDVRLVLGFLCHRRDGGCLLRGNRRAGEMSEE